MIGSFDGNIYCVDAKTGKEIWRFRTGEEVICCSYFFVNRNILYFGSMDNYLYAVDITGGKEIWRFRTGSYGNSSIPVPMQNLFTMAARDGYFYALDMKRERKYGESGSKAALLARTLVVKGTDIFFRRIRQHPCHKFRR